MISESLCPSRRWGRGEPGELATLRFKAKSSGEDPRATGGLVSNLPRPRVNKTKQHTLQLEQPTHCAPLVCFLNFSGGYVASSCHAAESSFFLAIKSPGPSLKYSLNTQNSKWHEMALGHLGQSNEIHCDSRPHEFLSNYIFMLGYLFGMH